MTVARQSGQGKQFLYTFTVHEWDRWWVGGLVMPAWGVKLAAQYTLHVPCQAGPVLKAGVVTHLRHAAMSNLNCWNLDTTHPNALDVVSALSLLLAWSGSTSDNGTVWAIAMLTYAALHNRCIFTHNSHMLLCTAKQRWPILSDANWCCHRA